MICYKATDVSTASHVSSMALEVRGTLSWSANSCETSSTGAADSDILPDVALVLPLQEALCDTYKTIYQAGHLCPYIKDDRIALDVHT